MDENYAPPEFQSLCDAAQLTMTEAARCLDLDEDEARRLKRGEAVPPRVKQALIGEASFGANGRTKNSPTNEDADADADFVERSLTEIDAINAALDGKYQGRLKLDRRLSRKLVSFQANKAVPVYRWYKYKEGFSAALVQQFLGELELPASRVLDPFAGAGTTLFAGAAMGLNVDGIELLPIGQEIIATRSQLSGASDAAFIPRLTFWAEEHPWKRTSARKPLNELRITQGAYPEDTQMAIERYLGLLAAEQPPVRALLQLALLSILESVSYTRKDGQYLRWDHRSPRSAVRGRFNKGHIPGFDEAIVAKLREIITDLGGARGARPPDGQPVAPGKVRIMRGSCLDVLPSLPDAHYGAIVTSPPYCNRYDYTRTYALEHALLGSSERDVFELRQAMLTCTVENRQKALIDMNPAWEPALRLCEESRPLQTIIRYLEELGRRNRLNNGNIPRMVKGYFSELACVVQETVRVLKPGGWVVMVNDNVRYAGANIPVDTILSDIAAGLGLTTEAILILPQNKGNSSQQMGAHGRTSLRKSVYVWRKRDA